MPSIFRKDGKKKELIKNLGNIYQTIQREQQISPGDFPELKKMQVKHRVYHIILFILLWHKMTVKKLKIYCGCNYIV